MGRTGKISGRHGPKQFLPIGAEMDQVASFTGISNPDAAVGRIYGNRPRCMNPDDFQDKIPIAPETVRAAEEMGIEPFICALNGGEDYELLFTLPLNLYDKVMQIEGISAIGHMTEKDNGTKFITLQESEIELHSQGWNALLNDK